jgi:hypothetical protein
LSGNAGKKTSYEIFSIGNRQIIDREDSCFEKAISAAKKIIGQLEQCLKNTPISSLLKNNREKASSPQS